MRAGLERKRVGRMIRVHGDYHLGQLLYTGRDFAVIDFDGEPARSLGERRRKRLPLADVAGMLRSFHYAVETVLSGGGGAHRMRPEDRSPLEPWGRAWYAWVSAVFLREYLATVRPLGILPERDDELAAVLNVHLLEKALYELGYELNHRPEWVGIPLRGIRDILATWTEDV
jgi:maltose alpha-D-glucosyltransferase/alpha-amylase